MKKAITNFAAISIAFLNDTVREMEGRVVVSGAEEIGVRRKRSAHRGRRA